MSIYEWEKRVMQKHDVEAIVGAPLAVNKAEAMMQMWNWLRRQGAFETRQERGDRVSIRFLYSPLIGRGTEAGTLYLALEQAVLNLGPQSQKEECSELETLLEKVQDCLEDVKTALKEKEMAYCCRCRKPLGKKTHKTNRGLICDGCGRELERQAWQAEEGR